MVVAIVAGRGGVGKTSQLLFFAQTITPSMWAIMEQKDIKAVNAAGVVSVPLCKFTSTYMIDPHRTLNAFEGWRDAVLSPPHDLKLVVVDGISDLRDYAIEEWIALDNEKRVLDKRPPRKSIGEDNLGAWGEVNKRVRLLLEPLINFGISHSVHVFSTAQMKQVYKDNKRTGEEPDIKEWIEYPCEAILILHKEGARYYCTCEKAPIWSKGTFTEDLVKDMGLLTVLGKWELLQ